jgi:hypothetical protein
MSRQVAELREQSGALSWAAGLPAMTRRRPASEEQELARLRGRSVTARRVPPAALA